MARVAWRPSRSYHVNNTEQDFWQEFATILALGGRFLMGRINLPRRMCLRPGHLTSTRSSASRCIGTRVRLRAAPRLDARTKGLLDYAIVQVFGNAPAVKGWRQVRLADGRTGYVSSRYVRSPIERRAIFEFKERRWWLTAYVAGD